MERQMTTEKQNPTVGMTGNSFKKRDRYSNETELSKHVWDLKKQGRTDFASTGQY